MSQQTPYIPGTAPQTFTLFPNLPAELQAMIWREETTGPRVITAQGSYHLGGISRLFATPAIPSVAQVNYDARAASQLSIPPSFGLVYQFRMLYMNIKRDVLLFDNSDAFHFFVSHYTFGRLDTLAQFQRRRSRHNGLRYMAIAGQTVLAGLEKALATFYDLEVVYLEVPILRPANESLPERFNYMGRGRTPRILAILLKRMQMRLKMTWNGIP